MQQKNSVEAQERIRITLHVTINSEPNKHPKNDTNTENCTARLEGWVGVLEASRAVVNSNKKTDDFNKPCDLDPPRSSTRRLAAVCERNVFHFFQSLASSKQP